MAVRMFDTQPDLNSREADVIVIGGGLHGMSSAFHLARRGKRVIVLEADYCGRHASGVNAGGVRTLGRDLAEIPLSLASRDIWHELGELLGDDAEFTPSGQLLVAENEQDIVTINKRVALLESHGFTHEKIIDGKTARELVPTISPHVCGGIWVKDDGHALPYRAVTAFRLAAQRMGVAVHETTPAQRLDWRDGRWHVTTPRGTFSAEHVVNNAGAWAAEFAAQVGDPVPLEIGGLMLMITYRLPPFVKPVLGAAGRPLSFKQFANGTVLIGGGLRCPVDVIGRHGEVDFIRLASSAQTVTDLFPHLRELPVNRAWAGVEAFMPDNIPVIGPSMKSPNIVHAFGFSAHGFELGPIVGRIVSELVCDGSTAHPIAPFSAGRFRPAPAADVLDVQVPFSIPTGVPR